MVNENVDFDASPAVDPGVSFAPKVEGWPKVDGAPPAGGLNENVGLDVTVDAVEAVVILSPDVAGPVD